MPDPRFFITGSPLTAAEAAATAGAVLAGEGEALVRRVAGVEENHLAEAAVFIDSQKRLAGFGDRKAALVLAPQALSTDASAAALAVGVTASPKLGFARIAAALHRDRLLPERQGVASSARIGEDARIHPTATIGDDAVIGERAQIGPYTVIGPGVVIGSGSVIGAGACVMCTLAGAGLVLAPGAKIGQPGFGFAAGPEGLVRIPQLGRVLLGENVEIGANSTVDRGALGDTVIGDGVKIDNLVQIGHNVRIGRGSVFAAQIGVAGSTVIGEGVMVGGQAGVADHLTIGDGAQIAARSGVMHNVPEGEKWGGAPAKPARIWLREIAMLSKLARKSKRENHEN